jgi:hypothetical protein
MNQQLLKSYLHYDPETGHFTWLKASGGKPAGAPAGFVQKNGRHAIGLLKKTYQAHRLAWLYVHGEWPACQIDHINRDPLDNRISNLRDVDQAANMQNLSSMRGGKLYTPLLGVTRHKSGKWQASITVGKAYRYLGLYATADAAHAAYLEAKSRLHLGAIPSSNQGTGFLPKKLEQMGSKK